MIVGAAAVEIHIHGSRSLKQKRGVVRSISQRVRNQFNLSVAEVGGWDRWQYAVLGLSTTGSDAVVVRRVLDRALEFIEELHLAEVLPAGIAESFLPETAKTVFGAGHLANRAGASSPRLAGMRLSSLTTMTRSRFLEGSTMNSCSSKPTAVSFTCAFSPPSPVELIQTSAPVEMLSAAMMPLLEPAKSLPSATTGVARVNPPPTE